jgi:hypothetical protein
MDGVRAGPVVIARDGASLPVEAAEDAAVRPLIGLGIRKLAKPGRRRERDLKPTVCQIAASIETFDSDACVGARIADFATDLAGPAVRSKGGYLEDVRVSIEEARELDEVKPGSLAGDVHLPAIGLALVIHGGDI